MNVGYQNFNISELDNGYLFFLIRASCLVECHVSVFLGAALSLSMQGP